jgi:hypothetical protein
MQQHLEFQVVTPRTLSEFQGDTLILPDVRVVNDGEQAWFRKYLDRGKTLIITGEDGTNLGSAPNLIRFSKCPGKDYSAALKKDFEATAPERESEFLRSLKFETPVRVIGSSRLATSISQVDGTPHVFFMNVAGLQGGVNPVQTPQTDVQVTIARARTGHGFFLPFLGNVQQLNGTAGGSGISFKLPAIEKGGVFWYEP